MFDKVIIFLVVFFAALLQMSAFSNVLFLGVSPNLLLILVIFWTVHEGFEEALPKILFAGFMLDLFSFYPVGVNILTFTLIAFLVNSFSKRFLVAARNWRKIILVFLIMTSTVIFELVLFLLFKLSVYFKVFQMSNVIFSINRGVIAKEILINMLFFFLVGFPLMRIGQFLNLRKSRKNLNYV